MNITVTKNQVILDTSYILNDKEYNVNQCYFTFSNDYSDNLVKKAVFIQGTNAIEMLITNNQCGIPEEVLNNGTFQLHVYAYEADGEELVLRYSPSYTTAYVRTGSYVENTTNTEPITPTDKEQIEQALQNVETQINNLDINATKTDNTTTITVTKKDGTQEIVQILDGTDGVGIESIEKTSTDELVDTYTINYTNGNTSTFDVTNGRSIVSIEKTASQNYVDTYTITYNDNTTSTFTVTNSEVTNEEFNNLKNRYDALISILPKVSGSGTSISLNNTSAYYLDTELNSTQLTQDGTPTPDNPVNINVITGSNNIKIQNKNLFNINGDVNTRYNGQTGNYNSVENNNLTTTYSTNDGYSYGQRIYVGAGKKVTISSVVTDINSTGSKSAIIMCFNDNTTTGVQSVAFDNTEINTRKSFSFTPNTDYIIVTFAGRYNGFVSATFTDIQVEYGETVTTYIPHQEQNYTINLGTLEYCKIGDYADQLFKNTTNSPYYDNTLIENEWYLKKNVGKIESYNGETITTPYISTTGGLDTGATVYYGLATPTYIHITAEDYPTLQPQLEAIYNNAVAYDSQTNVSQTNANLPFNISISTIAKME